MENMNNAFEDIQMVFGPARRATNT